MENPTYLPKIHGITYQWGKEIILYSFNLTLILVSKQPVSLSRLKAPKVHMNTKENLKISWNALATLFIYQIPCLFMMVYIINLDK